MMEVNSDAVKNNFAQKPGMLGPYIKVNWKWSNQEMARVNIDILGIIERKWTGMGEFNSDDHYIYYGRNPLEEMEQPSQSTKESEMWYLDAISKMTE